MSYTIFFDAQFVDYNMYKKNKKSALIGRRNEPKKRRMKRNVLFLLIFLGSLSILWLGIRRHYRICIDIRRDDSQYSTLFL